MLRITTIRETVGSAQEGVGRAFAFTSGRATFLERLIFGFLTLAGTLVVVVVIIPVIVFLVVFTIVAGAVGYVWLRVRGWFTRAKQPNGTLDGRRNVRVREP